MENGGNPLKPSRSEDCAVGTRSQADNNSEQRFCTLALSLIENEQALRAKLACVLHDEVPQEVSSVGLQLYDASVHVRQVACDDEPLGKGGRSLFLTSYGNDGGGSVIRAAWFAQEGIPPD